MRNKSKSEYPLISIFCFCKNCVRTIRRCIDSVVTQDYPNIEVIVQDGASTDGTLEILQSYGNKIKLVSEPDSRPEEGFIRVLKRITGEFFGSCLSDEELMPGAISWGVENLLKHPEAAAIYSDFYISDIDGKIIGEKHPSVPWDYEKYFCSETTPPFCSSFFRTACYKALGFHDYTGEDEFDIWINLGAKFPIRYIPGMAIAKYATHTGEAGLQKDKPAKRFLSRKAAIEKICSNPQTPQWIRSLRDKAINSLYSWQTINYCRIKAWDLAKKNAPDAFRVSPNPEKLHELSNHLYQHSIELYQKGQLEQSLEFIDLITQSKFVFKDINGQKAKILFKLGRINEAAKAAHQELKLQPDHYISKAIVRLSEENYTQRIPQPYKNILARELFKAGIKFLQEGRSAEATKYFDEVLLDCPRILDLHYALATAYFQFGDIISAQKACEIELNLQPEHNGVKKLLAKIQKAIDEYKQLRIPLTITKTI
jgi:glycosyltransferase involved in cell wall biosynthesis